MTGVACELRGERAVNEDVVPIAIYTDCNRNRSINMSDSQLHTFSAFADRPPLAYIERWRQHINDTGEPETYTDVSTSQPSRSANVILLSEEIRVPTPLRPGGEKVPCPLCSPLSPKFGKGRMAYFPDDKAVRFIGHSCAKHYLGENYSAAERLFKIEEACSRYLLLWPKLQQHREALLAVAKKLSVVARGERMTRAMLDQKAPSFATFLFRDRVNKPEGIATSKAAGAKTTIIKGMAFISEDFHPNKQADKLLRACEDLSSFLPDWSPEDGESDAAKEIIRRGRRAEVSIRQIGELDAYIRDARKFLLSDNLTLLERWEAAGLSPFSRLKIRRDGDYLHLDVEWFAGSHSFAMPIHSGFDAALPNEEELLKVNLSEILN